MKAYKGFNKDMTCRGFQYEEGKGYITDNAELCKSGFHACENPLDCFRYYPPTTSEYHEVEIEDVTDERDSEGTKICGKKIKIGAKLSVAKLCELHFEFVKSHTTNSEKGGDNSSLSGGNCSSLSGGNCSSLSGGNCSSLSGGYRSSLSGGDDSSLSGGYRSSLSGGDNSSLSSRGTAIGGKNSIIVVRGNNVKAKGGIGSVIVIVNEKGNNYDITEWKAGVIDGETLKADTWYALKDGEFIEVIE